MTWEEGPELLNIEAGNGAWFVETAGGIAPALFLLPTTHEAFDLSFFSFRMFVGHPGHGRRVFGGRRV